MITRDPVKIIGGVIAMTLFLSSFKYGIGLLEIVSHVYERHNKTISEAIFVSNTLPCNNSDLLMRWDSINEFCRSQFKIASRSVIWETIVESSEYFHICYVKKHVHDESKKFGHSHSNELDVEIDCGYIFYYFFGIIVIFLVIFVLFKIKKKLLRFVKLKRK